MTNFITDKAEIIEHLNELSDGQLMKIATTCLQSVFFMKYENDVLYYVTCRDVYRELKKKVRKVKIERLKSIMVI